MNWIVLILIAQFTWALGNYIDRYLLERYRTNDETENDNAVGTLLVISAFFGFVVAGVLYVAAALYNIDPFTVPQSELWLAFGVGVMEIMWLIPYFYAMDKADETAVAPIFQTVPIFGLLLGLFVFVEIPTPVHTIAALTIVVGALVLNLEFRSEGLFRISWRTLSLMLLASFIIALSAFVFKIAALGSSYLATAFWMSLGGAFTGLLLYVVIPTYRRQFNHFTKRADWKGIGLNTFNEITDNIAILAFYGAILLGPSTALVQSTTAYQPVFVLLIGLAAARFGSEFHVQHLTGKELIKRILGIAIIVAGSILIFL